MPPIYLDYNATTPADPAVLEVMLPFLKGAFGNPSSSHAYGKAAHAAVDKARAQVASLIGAEPDEIVFTGGGTEASNQAIELSPVLAAMGVPPEVGRGAVRLSVGRFTTEDEIDRAAELLIAAARG